MEKQKLNKSTNNSLYIISIHVYNPSTRYIKKKLHASPKHIAVRLSRDLHQVLPYHCSHFTSSRFCHVTDCKVPVLRKVYTKFRTNGQPTCELEWGDRKKKAILKPFFFVCVFFGNNVRYKYFREPQSKLVGRELKTSDASINFRVMES